MVSENGTGPEQTTRMDDLHAFTIGKSDSVNWPRFLLNWTILKLRLNNTEFVEYSDFAYGSWNITAGNQSLIYDGRDEVLLAKRLDAAPMDYKMTPISQIGFDKMMEYVEFLSLRS